MGALDYLSQNRDDEEGAFEVLSDLVYKIGAEAKRGTPLLCADGREWIEGSFSAEFLVARDYIGEQAKQDAEPLGPIVYPGNWLMHSPANPLPPWAEVDPDAHCELCAEAVNSCEHWFIQRTDPERARCCDCQSVIWQLDGYEVTWPGGVAIPALTQDNRQDYFKKPDLKHDARRLVESIVTVLGEAYVPKRAKELAGA